MGEITKRLNWIDVLKGIGIILVVLGHNLDKSMLLFKIIYSFHMPLFFLISGFLFNGCYIVNWKSLLFLVKNKYRRLLRPYIYFGILTILPCAIFKEGNIFYLRELFFGNRHFIATLEFNTPIWFLPCLFVVFLLSSFFNIIIKNRYVLMGFIILFSLLGFRTLDNPFLPFTADSAAYYLLFFSIGFLFKGVDPQKIFKWIPFMLTIFMYCLCFDFFCCGKKINLFLSI